MGGGQGKISDPDRAVAGHATRLEANTADAVAAVFGTKKHNVWVEIRLECKSLLNMDIGSDSDPVAVMSERKGDEWQEIGRTEIVPNDLNPKFLKSFEVIYQFEHIQEYKVSVYDVDESGDPYDIDLAKQDFLGETTFTLSSLVSSNLGKLELNLWDPFVDGPAGNGVLVVRMEERRGTTDFVELTLGASDVVGQWSNTKPILVISRSQEDGAWVPVYRSESNQNASPRWNTLEMSVAQICNGDMDRTLRFEVKDFKPSGKHKLLAQTEASLNVLREYLDAHMELQLPKSGKLGGKLWVYGFVLTKQASFLEYLTAGFEINFLVAVDFTASNGMIGFPTSLHHLDPAGKRNPYQQAIAAVGKVLEFYDDDKKFPTWGFGALIPGTGNKRGFVSHCFALNKNDLSPECIGIDGVLEAYSESLKHVKLAGPTFFAPVINAAIQAASRPSYPPKYYCLMILTDGVIMDMRNTIRAIVSASRLPLSILIVGVGDEDFKNMEILDADRSVLQVDGVKAERDIVQFVEYNRFKGDAQALAAQLLAELPGQFLSYMRKQKIMPTTNGSTSMGPA